MISCIEQMGSIERPPPKQETHWDASWNLQADKYPSAISAAFQVKNKLMSLSSIQYLHEDSLWFNHNQAT